MRRNQSGKSPGHSSLESRELYVDGAEFVLLATMLLSSGYSLRFRAKGSSMYPSIRSGDRVLVVPMAGQSVERGQVVLYRDANNQPVLHRIVACAGTDDSCRVLVRGDGAAESSVWLSSSIILGRVVRVESGHRAPWRDRIRSLGRSLRRRIYTQVQR